MTFAQRADVAQVVADAAEGLNVRHAMAGDGLRECDWKQSAGLQARQVRQIAKRAQLSKGTRLAELTGHVRRQTFIAMQPRNARFASRTMPRHCATERHRTSPRLPGRLER